MREKETASVVSQESIGTDIKVKRKALSQFVVHHIFKPVSADYDPTAQIFRS